MAFLKNHADDVEFLGFVNVYVKPNAERTIQAFNVVGMVLFRFEHNSTELGSLVVAHEMQNSSMQERLIQIVQILQLRRHSSARVHFGFPVADVEQNALSRRQDLPAGSLRTKTTLQYLRKRYSKWRSAASHRYG